jgi:rod shape-determining protein MreC
VAVQVAVERRPTLFFLIVLGVLFVLMAASTRTIRGVGETRTLAERTVMTIFSPVPKLVNRIGQSISDVFHGYVDMRAAVAENVRLRNEATQLTTENLRLRQTTSDLGRMRSLLDYSEQLTMPTLLGEIVMLDIGGRFKSAILDVGTRAGAELNDPVVNAQGLAGRVILTTNDLSKVQLILDGTASVGVLIDRTRRQGVLKGNGDGTLSMMYVPNQTDVVAGDTISTAGIDGIYPKGIPVARIVKAEEGKDLFEVILCRPLVDFGNLEQLLVLRTKKIPEVVVRYGH